MEHINECSNKTIGTVNHTCNELKEVKVEFNDEEQLTCNTHVTEKKLTIKIEPVDTDEEHDSIDNSNDTNFKEIDVSYEKDKVKSESTDISKSEFAISIKEENMSDDEVIDYEASDEIAHEATQIEDKSNEVVKQRRKTRKNSLPQRNQRNNKKLIVTIDNIMSSKYNTEDSCKQLTDNDESRKHNENNTRKEERKKIAKRVTKKSGTVKASDPGSSQTLSTRSGNVTDNDTECIEKVFICDICNQIFDRELFLIRHILKHKKLNNCSQCSHKTHSKDELVKHIHTHHTKSTVFNCSVCSYKTNHRGALNRHINSQHTKSTAYDCPYCDFKSYEKSNLNQHINTKHVKGVMYDCPHCSYRTCNKSSLGRHINSKHTKSTGFNCSYCDYKSYDKGALNIHINSQHTKSIVYSCTDCDYKTYDKSHLNQHVNAKHTKNSVYYCSHCSYKTYYKSDLNKHVKIKHS